MKNLKICIAICPELLSFGIKQIILEKDSTANLLISKDLEETIDCLSNHSIDLLIFDCNMINSHNKQFLPNTMKANPDLKVILFTEKFDYVKFKYLFQLGLYSVINPNTEITFFKNAFLRILNGEKILDPNFVNDLVSNFCKSSLMVGAPEYASFESNVYTIFLNELSSREREILSLICNGQSSKEISKDLKISTNTVETHRRNIQQKFGAKNTAEMVKIGVLAQYESSLS